MRKPKSQKCQKQQKSAAGCSASSKVTSKKISFKRNEKGETLLHKACKQKDLEQVKRLLQAGISVNMEDYAGWTALHEACTEGADAVVEELLKAGAMVNTRSCDGVTPLHDAVFSGHCQVVKLLLQSGANPYDRTLSGKSAFEMADEENIRELLMTFQASSVTQVTTWNEGGSGHSGAGPEVQHQSFLQSGESGDGGGATETIDIPLRTDDVTTNISFRVQSHLVAVTEVLEEVRSKQEEMLTWPLSDLLDLGRYQATLIQTHSALTGVLARQRSEKDELTRKYRTVPHHFHQLVLKNRVLDLLSCHRNLLEILQKQKQLEEAYFSAKARVSTEPSLDQGGNNLTGEEMDQNFSQDSTPDFLLTPSCYLIKEQTSRPVTQAGASQHLKRVCSCQRDPNMRGKNVLLQRSVEDQHQCLHQLIQGGAVAPGSTLELVLKGKQHTARLTADGTLMSKGRLHRAPERWLESILGKNIPVSSSYALDKVTFRDKPLSFYFKNMVAKESCSQVNAERDSSPSWLVPGQFSHQHTAKSSFFLPD
ncbi:ankyrin repeat domain-containing protein 31 isoform X1 [Nothobranchius furzeri]|uniref:ankyrin repeat domain-containing protein 31 isoform X1 n=1 Tax=Nothobranchius furzeri TaxID=105023 RepID=UPI0024046C1F|nr:ankyrin repeat domain-containing protein 31 isoform X1 [Nothobranchius furzeri]